MIPQGDNAASPRLSAELFSIPLDLPDSFLVYAPLRQVAFIANRSLVNFIASLNAGVLDLSLDPELNLCQFLEKLQIINAPPENKPITDFSGEPMPTAVTLFLTTTCNLRCTYCYASAGDTTPKFMPLDVALRGIDFVINNALKKQSPEFEVAYHGGGEPAVNWKTLVESHGYARKRADSHRLRLKSSCATNGVLSDNQIRWIVSNLDGVSLSFDGTPSAQDKNRPMVSGRGSSDQVINTLREFDQAGFAYGIRVTVTAAQIPSLPEAIAFICREFQPQSIQVEPVYQLGRGKTAVSAETEEFVAAYRNAQLEARKRGKDIEFSGARLGHLSNHFCGVTQDSFSLSADGNVSACYECFSEENFWASVFFYGKPSPNKGYEFDMPKLNHLRSQAVQNREYCQGCFAKWSCAGDCYHKSLSVNGPGEFSGTDRCHITRELTKDQILEKISAAGGVIWHEKYASLLQNQDRYG